MNKEEIQKIIDEYKDRIIIHKNVSYSGHIKHNIIILKQINKKYNNIFKNFSEFIYLINHNIDEKFCYCGKFKSFIDINHGYKHYCSNKCQTNSLQNHKKYKQTMLKTYGVDHNSKMLKFKQHMKQSKDKIQNKIRQTKLNDIDENGLNNYQRQAIKSKQTMLNTIDENGLNIYQRSAIKTKQTKKLKYGDENYYNIENNLQKYGVKYYFQTQQFKNYIKEHNDEIQQKMYQTKKKNNSFNKSQQEENIYNLLLQKFNKEDIIRQYKSKLYPFNCDFYIKSLDLYIEYHGTWTHSPTKRNENSRPFKNSVEDMKIVEKLKKKNSKYYNLAIHVWTNLDVRKLNTFKKNKLNYKIFYTIEQFKNWFNKII